MELKGPSEAELKKFIRLEVNMEFVLTTGQHFKGKLLWADNMAFHVKLENEKIITILRHAIIYYSAI